MILTSQKKLLFQIHLFLSVEWFKQFQDKKEFDILYYNIARNLRTIEVKIGRFGLDHDKFIIRIKNTHIGRCQL